MLPPNDTLMQYNYGLIYIRTTDIFETVLVMYSWNIRILEEAALIIME